MATLNCVTFYIHIYIFKIACIRCGRKKYILYLAHNAKIKKLHEKEEANSTTNDERRTSAAKWKAVTVFGIMLEWNKIMANEIKRARTEPNVWDKSFFFCFCFLLARMEKVTDKNTNNSINSNNSNNNNYNGIADGLFFCFNGKNFSLESFNFFFFICCCRRGSFSSLKCNILCARLPSFFTRPPQRQRRLSANGILFWDCAQTKWRMQKNSNIFSSRSVLVRQRRLAVAAGCSRFSEAKNDLQSLVLCFRADECDFDDGLLAPNSSYCEFECFPSIKMSSQRNAQPRLAVWLVSASCSQIVSSFIFVFSHFLDQDQGNMFFISR